MAVLIVVDGPDGAGKSTAVQSIVDVIKRCGYTAAPADVFAGASGETLRDNLRANTEGGARAVELLMAQHDLMYKQFSEAPYGMVYVMDRGVISTMAEQGILDETSLTPNGIYEQWIEIAKRYDVPTCFLHVTADEKTLVKRLGSRPKDARESKVTIDNRKLAYQASADILDAHSSVDIFSPVIRVITYDTTGSDLTVRARAYGELLLALADMIALERDSTL